jgi:DNA-binding PadR family transcriptional regulator
VYPTLQLLADEGLIGVEESNGRKTYTLTEEGRAVAEAAEGNAPWATEGVRESMRGTALPKAGIELAQAAAQVGRSGNPAQIDEAVAVLDEARRKLYSILAQD